MAALLKSAESKDFVGSNPTLSAIARLVPVHRGLQSKGQGCGLLEFWSQS